ncbi:unnamed protein product, partial [marine sediment metagenome]
ENKQPPSRGDIGRHFVMWPNGVQDHLKAMQKKGALTITKGAVRGIVLTKGYRVGALK